MPLVTTKQMFKKAYEGHYAIGAFNANNVDTIKAILAAAEEAKSPVIIALSEGALKFTGTEFIPGIVQVLKKSKVPVALHLDHGKDFDLCKKCVDLGFTSVMIDASALDFKDNIKATKKVVAYAHKHDVVVESELGAIAGIEEDINVDDKYGHFTHPDDVLEFVTKTGIDSLAIAIGTAHGAYKFKPGQEPQLRFDILKECQKKVPGFPLVLHGSSSVPKASLDLLNKYGGKMPEAVGIPEAMLKQASKTAVCKINVGTDLQVAFTGAVRKSLAENPESPDMRKFTKAGIEAVKALVIDKMKNVFGSANKAK